MSDLKIPNLNNKSKQYLFKNKIPLTRKSRKKLVKESILMSLFSLFIIVINYAIPGKLGLFNSFIININKVIIGFVKIIGYFYEIFIVIFILTSMFLAFILLIGSFYRIYKAFKRKSRRINF